MCGRAEREQQSLSFAAAVLRESERVPSFAALIAAWRQTDSAPTLSDSARQLPLSYRDIAAYVEAMRPLLLLELHTVLASAIREWNTTASTDAAPPAQRWTVTHAVQMRQHVSSTGWVGQSSSTEESLSLASRYLNIRCWRQAMMCHSPAMLPEVFVRGARSCRR